MQVRVPTQMKPFNIHHATTFREEPGKQRDRVMRTLIVEDNDATRLLLQKILETRGHEVTVCPNAESAWGVYQKKLFDLVILDWMLTGMDGVELCRKMRSVSHGDKSIILMFTNRNNPGDLQSGLDAGADDYLQKTGDISRLNIHLAIAERQVERLSKRIETEHELAQARAKESEYGIKIQQNFLQGQTPCTFPGVQIATHTIPSEVIDGHFYDFYGQNQNNFDLVVGDVMGRGMSSALLGAATKTHILRSINHLKASNNGNFPSPAQVLEAVHSNLADWLIQLERFVTLTYARFDIENKTLFFVNCGHPRIIHYKKSVNECELLHGNNLPLGFSRNEEYEQFSVSFDSGDVFFFYSDGVTEAKDPAGELFGESRLINLIQAEHDQPPDLIIDSVRRKITDFVCSDIMKKDITCVTVKVQDTDILTAYRDELKITSDMRDMIKIRDFVNEFCQNFNHPNIDQAFIRQMESTVEEVAACIMIHAYNRRIDCPISIQMTGSRQGIEIHLYHWGNSFSTDILRFKEDAFGRPLKQWLDKINCLNDQFSENCITLIKRL